MPDAIDPHLSAAKLIKRHVDTWLGGHFGGKPRTSVDVSIGERDAVPAEVKEQIVHLCLTGHGAWSEASITDDAQGTVLRMVVTPEN